MGRQEDSVLPGRLSPHFSMSQASVNHNRVGWIIESLSRWRIGLEATAPAFSLLLMGGDAMSGLKGSFDCFVGIDVSKSKTGAGDAIG